MKQKKGFTLVELLMVIAIIGIISMLAIQKLSGLQSDAKKKLNVANMQRVSNGIETYVAAHAEDYTLDFNRLDSLTMWSASSSGTPGSLTDLNSVQKLMIYTNQAENTNIGLSLSLLGSSNLYAESVKLLGTYYLNATDVTVLKRDLGISYLMGGYPETESLPGYGYGDDGAYVTGSATSPDKCACVALSNMVGRAVAVVNPAASNGRTPLGPVIYKAMGEDVIYSGKTYHVVVKGKDCADNETAYKELMTGEGILMAFGLGEYCALIGNSQAGFDSAPLCPTMPPDEYRRYIVLVRMTYTSAAGRSGTTYSAKKAEFAGIMDPAGNVMSTLR